MNAIHRRRFAEAGQCFICHLPVVEKGQRGRRRSHRMCRKLTDAGVLATTVRSLIHSKEPSVQSIRTRVNAIARLRGQPGVPPAQVTAEKLALAEALLAIIGIAA